VVSGAGGGINGTTARFFAREGAAVVVADKHAENGEAVAASIREAGGKALFVQADVTQPDDVKTLVRTAQEFLGGIDVWMNGAGRALTEDILDTTLDEWEADVRLNLTSHFLCCKAAIPVMLAGCGGSIINLSSVNAFWNIGQMGYSAAKAGLVSLTKNLAVNYGGRGIRANVILPGTIDTARGASYWNDRAGDKQKLLKWYPVGRLGKPEDIAHLAVYLASDESSFMNGAELVIDGGLTIGSTLFGEI
jgi:NAD(P)-dependent dehydrogenase (short-subunit alcohol dehydrogenase family)